MGKMSPERMPILGQTILTHHQVSQEEADCGGYHGAAVGSGEGQCPFIGRTH